MLPVRGMRQTEPRAQTAPAQADAQLAQIREKRERDDKNLVTFDDLDFNVYSGQKWDEFHRSHTEDIGADRFS